MADLNLRSRKILQAVVKEYLDTGDAVGSRTITRRHGIDLSPATVRNVMADLEELGLLKQPHTSAGRVPTEDGLRFFIDSLLKIRTLSAKEKEDIRLRYTLPADLDLDKVLDRVGKMLSDLSHQATIVVAPAPERQRLEHVEFIRLAHGEILVVLVSSGGQIENRMLKVDVPADPGFLERVTNYLNEWIGGKTLDEARRRVLEDLADDKKTVDALTVQALRLGEAAFRPESSPGVIVAGQVHLLDGPEDPDAARRMRALLSALDEKERIVQLLDRTLAAEGIQVWLGAESPFASVGDLSIVATSYGEGERAIGTIAVIGPTRMNYSKVIPLVDFTAELVSGVLASRR